MNYTAENIIWIIPIVVVLQILKLAHYGYYLRKIKKKKLKFDKEWNQKKNVILLSK